jgi:hypothetical protein
MSLFQIERLLDGVHEAGAKIPAFAVHGSVVTFSPRFTVRWPPRPGSNVHRCLASHRFSSWLVMMRVCNTCVVWSTKMFCTLFATRFDGLAACGESHFADPIPRRVSAANQPIERKVDRERAKTLRTTASVLNDPIPRG